MALEPVGEQGRPVDDVAALALVDGGQRELGTEALDELLHRDRALGVVDGVGPLEDALGLSVDGAGDSIADAVLDAAVALGPLLDAGHV